MPQWGNNAHLNSMLDVNKSMISKVREYPDFDKSMDLKSNIASKILKVENDESVGVTDESHGISSKL